MAMRWVKLSQVMQSFVPKICLGASPGSSEVRHMLYICLFLRTSRVDIADTVILIHMIVPGLECRGSVA